MPIFFNGTILTQDPAHANPEAVWFQNDRIRGVGALSELRQAAGEQEPLLDLHGRCLLPGFVEAHIHVWKVGNLRTHLLDVRGVRDIPELQTKLRAYAEAHPNATWIQARGFNEAAMTERRMPTRHDLDEAIPDRPVMVQRTCAHISVLNTSGLAHAGISRHTVPPLGGEIHHDEQGEPNGILLETAQGLGFKATPPFSTEHYEDMIAAAGEVLLENGFTTATDPGVLPDLLAVYRNLDTANQLPIRFNVMPIRLPDGGTEPLPLTEPHESDHLVINTVKFFADGGLSGKTSAVSRPYRNTDETGVLRLPADFFYTLAHEPHQRGWKIATHAIGDVAIEGVLQTYERLYHEFPSPARHRIEHLGLPNADQLARIAALHISAVPQPMFIRELGMNFRRYLDDEFLAGCYPMRAMLRAGIKVAFSSDAPVVRSFSALVNLHAAYNRTDAQGEVIAPDESVSIQDGLYAHTMGGAIANGMEDRIGSITVGKFADFVILDQSPLAVPPEEVASLHVMETWLGGIQRFARS